LARQSQGVPATGHRTQMTQMTQIGVPYEYQEVTNE